MPRHEITYTEFPSQAPQSHPFDAFLEVLQHKRSTELKLLVLWPTPYRDFESTLDDIDESRISH